jgi:phosphatidylserine/phosphatidylglycerophosphate/cardiolipin synthase-like enzyme
MATEISLFTAPPATASDIREAHPYGPTAAGAFHTDLGIEINPSAAANLAVLAVTDGMLRVIPDSASATSVALVLRPTLRAQLDLESIVGSAIVFFVYRNIDVAALKTAIRPKIAADRSQFVSQLLGSDSTALENEITDLVNRFTQGSAVVKVVAGNELGRAGASGAANVWSQLGFEIVYLPSGVGMNEQWQRVVQLVDRTAVTRRFDPITFYSLVKTGTPQVMLKPEHSNHRLLTVSTRRTLLELRDEYDQPYVGIAAVNDGSATGAVNQNFTAAARGTIVLATAPASGNPSAKTYTIGINNRVFTELPSGDNALPAPSRTLVSPSHWRLQHIFMADVNDPAHWFSKETPRGALPLFTQKNKITPIIDGLPTFKEFHEALLTVQGPGHYMRLAGWQFLINFKLVPGNDDSTLQSHLARMDAAGAQIRTLLWDKGPGTENSAEVNHINALPGGNGQAILDNHTLNFGSHHQKFMVINGSAGAVGFAGGIDINPDRLDDRDHKAGSPFHDIHSKVEGPSVADLNTTFVERWNNHPDDRQPKLSTAAPPFTPAPGTHYVHITRTIPPGKNYNFIPNGDLSTLNTTRRAIQRARRFIYIEEQYLTPYPGTVPFTDAADTVKILSDLIAALARIEFLIIVIPNSSDQPGSLFRRRNFIKVLKDLFPGKVHVFYLWRPTSGPLIYLHTKSLIIDDVYFRIGSANLNRRSMTHDSEIDVHVIDEALANGSRRAAKEYRIDLWGEHLNMGGARAALLDDPSVALTYWLQPPSGARIRGYNEEQYNPPGSGAILDWDIAVDPDGR